MGLPVVILQVGFRGFKSSVDLCRRIAFEGSAKTIVVLIILEHFKCPRQINHVAERDHIKEPPANGSDKSPNERVRTGCIESSPHNFQLRHYRLIQQINRLLESLILYKCRISLFRSLHRRMAQQMLNVSNGSTSAQQSSGKRLSQIV